MNAQRCNDNILADLLWLEYQDAANDARWRLSIGDKPAALALAIYAHKIRTRYEDVLQRIILSA